MTSVAPAILDTRNVYITFQQLIHCKGGGLRQLLCI